MERSLSVREVLLGSGQVMGQIAMRCGQHQGCRDRGAGVVELAVVELEPDLAGVVVAGPEVVEPEVVEPVVAGVVVVVVEEPPCAGGVVDVEVCGALEQ